MAAFGGSGTAPPSPPVAAINRAQYAELARRAANLNQLTRLANALLARVVMEARRLRLALLGIG